MLINLETLKKWSGYNSPSAIRRWLDDNGINYFTTPSGEICTTEDAITFRLTGQQQPKKKKIAFK